jgi:hypothetical protein
MRHNYRTVFLIFNFVNMIILKIFINNIIIQKAFILVGSFDYSYNENLFSINRLSCLFGTSLLLKIFSKFKFRKVSYFNFLITIFILFCIVNHSI